MSTIPPSNLCIIERLTPTKKVVCEATLAKTTLYVLGLLGIGFLASGLYMLLGGIGTIPAFTGACGLLGAGILALFITTLLACRLKN